MRKLWDKCAYILILQFVLVAAVLANTLTLSEHSEVLAETDNYRVRFKNGVLIHFHNKLTQETYTLPIQGPSNIRRGLSIQYEEGEYGRTQWLDDSWEVESKRLTPFAIEIAYQRDYRTGQTCRLRIGIDPRTQDLVIHQTGTSELGGLIGVMWGCGYLNSQKVDVILPANGGQIINDATELTGLGFEYPRNWEAQLAILQGENGGFFVRSTDTTHRFKAVGYKRNDKRFGISFQTDNLAPFHDKNEIISVEWRLNAYQGDWQVPALAYRNWMETAFQPKQPPAWVKDLELVIFAPFEPLDTSDIPLLASHVNPSTTLLYIIGWYVPSLGLEPDYPPDPKFGDFLEAAHAYGFRVMPRVTFLGCSPNHPLYPEFEPFQFRDTIRGWKLGYELDDPTYDFPTAYINPASKAFRTYLVEQMKKVYETYPIDALHLDINHFIENNPPIDGLTPAEGNILLHQELAEAMPGIVQGGEMLHEVTFRNINLTSRWNIPDGEQPHPISSFLFSPWTVPYGAHVPNPDREPEFYQAFEEAYQVWDILPTLRIRNSSVLHPSMVLTLRKLKNITTGYFWDIFSVGDVYPIGDVNEDGIVNVLDLVVVANALGKSEPDVNGDGVVNILDLTIVAQHID